MIDVDLRTETRTTRQHTVRLSGQDIWDLLLQELKAQGVSAAKTRDAKIEVIFCVPGGGDYSSTEVEVDETNPVIVRWEEVERS